MNKLAVVALGGNAVVQGGQEGNIEQQNENSRLALRQILPCILDRGYRLVLTHGNGPQVGNVLTRVEAARNAIYTLPLDVCVADTQGGMGYMFQRIADDVLAEMGRTDPVATVITQVVVSPDDPGFVHPTKPIGRFHGEAEAAHLRDELGWTMVEDSGRGYRQVVASPRPRRIVEIEAVRILTNGGAIAITVGGGGIPVVETPQGLRGVAAVIDKDLSSALLATELKAEVFIILTGVQRVALDFRSPKRRELAVLNAGDARRYLGEGQFPPGSMGPKVEAALRYLESGGSEVLITSAEHLADALAGKNGTRIVPNEPTAEVGW